MAIARGSRSPSTKPDWSWQQDAACHGEDMSLFFGPKGESQAERDRRELKAKTICQQCPVRLACRETAFLLKMDNGVWGGLGEEERLSRRRTWVRYGRPSVGVA